MADLLVVNMSSRILFLILHVCKNRKKKIQNRTLTAYDMMHQQSWGWRAGPLILSDVTCLIYVQTDFKMCWLPFLLWYFYLCHSFFQLGGFWAPWFPRPAVHPGEGRVPQLGSLQRLSVLPHRTLHVIPPHLLCCEWQQREERVGGYKNERVQDKREWERWW